MAYDDLYSALDQRRAGTKVNVRVRRTSGLVVLPMEVTLIE